MKNFLQILAIIIFIIYILGGIYRVIVGPDPDGVSHYEEAPDYDYEPLKF